MRLARKMGGIAHSSLEKLETVNANISGASIKL